MRSCVAAQSRIWRSSRGSSPLAGGETSDPVAFITSTTFFRDSGMASCCNREVSARATAQGA